jgi:glycosyltransferase involved in cell wall biosynthesis
MKIGILGSRGYPYVYSGYETFVAELSTRLVRRGHRVVVYCHRSLFAARPRYVNGVELVYVPAFERKTLSQFSHSLLSSLHASVGDCDILLYVNSANGPFGLVARAAGKKTVINVDGLEWLRPKWHGLGARYFKWASRMATCLFDATVTDSVEMARVYREEFDAQSSVIAYGAYIEQSSSPALLEPFGLEREGYYLVVARLVPDNNADLIVRGFERSTTTRSLVIVGDVPYRDEYASAVRCTTDPRIVFTGYVRDPAVLRELYCNAYAYIHGHEYGGTNPTLLKALGCGCGILALDTPFAREVLCSDFHGIYFEKNPESLRARLDEVDAAPDRINALRTSAQSRVKEAYDWERITDQYEELCSRLADRTPA